MDLSGALERWCLQIQEELDVLQFPDAIDVTFDPGSSSLTSTNVQDAIDELDAKIAANSGTPARDSLDINQDIPKDRDIGFWSSGLNTLDIPLAMGRTGKLIKAIVNVDALDTARDFEVKIYKDGSGTPSATLTFVKNIDCQAFTLSIDVVESSKISATMERSTGLGRSTFRKVRLTLETQET